MYFHVFTMIHESIWSGRKLSCLYKHVDDYDYDYDYVDKILQFYNLKILSMLQMKVILSCIVFDDIQISCIKSQVRTIHVNVWSNGYNNLLIYSTCQI